MLSGAPRRGEKTFPRRPHVNETLRRRRHEAPERRRPRRGNVSAAARSEFTATAPKRFRGPGSAEDAEEGWPRGRAAEAPAPFPETPKRFHPAEVGNTGATAKRFSGRSSVHGTSGESRRRGTQRPSVACSLARQSAAQKTFRRRSGRGSRDGETFRCRGRRNHCSDAETFPQEASCARL